MIAALVLMGGGALIFLFPNRISPRFLYFTLLLTPGLAILSLALSPPPLAPWGGGDQILNQPLFSTSGISLGFSLTTGLVLLAILGYYLNSTQLNPLLVPELGRAIFFSGLGLVFLASNNDLSLLLAWGLLDMALLWIFSYGDAPEPSLILRAFGWNIFGGIAWLSFAFTGISLPLLLLAFWARTGLYPAMHSLSLLQGLPWPAGRIIQAVIIFCGGYLLARFPGVGLSSVWQITAFGLVILAITWAVLRLWQEKDGDKLGFYMAQVQMGFLLLAYIVHPPLTPQAIYLSVLSIILSWLVLDIAKHIGTYALERWQRLLVGAVLILGIGGWLGLPLTPGFTARLILYDDIGPEGSWWFIILWSIVTLLITPPLVHFLITMTSLRQANFSKMRMLWVAVLGLLILLFGIYPGFVLGRSYGPAIWDILALVSQVELALIFLAILLPLPIGYYLYRRWAVRDERLTPLAILFSIFDGEWLYAGLDRGRENIGRGLRALASWGEGRGGVGWYILFGLLLTLWALSP